MRPLLEDLMTALMRAQRMREALREPLEHAGGLPAWVEFERLSMLATANEICDEAGFPRVTYAEVLAAEQAASGHIDYSLKFALGVERLIEKRRREEGEG